MNRDDLLDVLHAQRIEVHDVVDAVQKLGPESDRQLFVGKIRRHDDQRVTKIDRAALGVRHAAVVENLQKNRRHVRVRFFQFVEQHDAVRPAPHRLR